MGKWFWLIVGAGVVYYLTQREKQKVPITINNQTSAAVQHAGAAVNNLIDKGAGALGTFLSGLGQPSRTPTMAQPAYVSPFSAADPLSEPDDNFDFSS